MAYNRGPTREAIPLSPIAFAATAFGLILASTIAAALVRTRLPEHHLTGDSKDVIKLAIALIATMSALVLALLFASTRTSFERTSGYVSRVTADIVEIDRLLKHYGPEAAPVRAALRTEIDPMIDSIWRDAAARRGARREQPTGLRRQGLPLRTRDSCALTQSSPPPFTRKPSEGDASLDV